MNYQPDITITDRFGALIALIEVKALREADTQAATGYLRRLLAYGGVPAARYLLLVTARNGYFWTSADDVLREAMPSLTFSIAGVIRHFLPAANSRSELDDSVLQVLVEQWLWNAVDGKATADDIDAELREIGFLDAVRGGAVHVFATV